MFFWSLFKVFCFFKFKYVFGSSFKKDKCYEVIRLLMKLMDGGSYCVVNFKFIVVVVELSGGGIFFVLLFE